MKPNVIERLNNIKIDNLVNYLLDHNWKQIPLKYDKYYYSFRYENESDKCSIFFPKSKAVEDYDELLLKAIVKVCKKDNLDTDTFIDYLIRDHSPIYAITCMEAFEEKILKDGWIKSDEDILKHYLDGFAISYRNGIYYAQTKDYSYKTSYNAEDYIRFLKEEDSQINHEGKEALGFQKRLI